MFLFDSMTLAELFDLYWRLSWYLFSRYGMQLIFIMFLVFAAVICFNHYFKN